MSTPDAHAVVSVEQNGRILSGVGVSAEDLQDTMARFDPPTAADAVPVVSPTSTPSEKAPAKGKARFHELTTERDTERQRADTAEAKARDLEAKLAAAPPPATPIATAQPQAVAQAAPVPEKFKFQTWETFSAANPTATYEDYNDSKIEAHTDWKIARLDLDARVRGSVEAVQTAKAFNDTADQAIARGRKAYADFDQVRASGPGASLPLPLDRIQVIVNHPQSEHLQYAIMKDAALAQQVATCHPFEFSALLASIAPSAPAAVSAVPAVVPPPPYTPVGSGSKTAVVASSALTKGHDFDNSGYREKRAAERAAARKR